MLRLVVVVFWFFVVRLIFFIISLVVSLLEWVSILCISVDSGCDARVVILVASWGAVFVLVVLFIFMSCLVSRVANLVVVMIVGLVVVVCGENLVNLLLIVSADDGLVCVPW